MSNILLQLFRAGLEELLADNCSADKAIFTKRLIFKIITLNVAD